MFKLWPVCPRAHCHQTQPGVENKGGRTEKRLMCQDVKHKMKLQRCTERMLGLDHIPGRCEISDLFATSDLTSCHNWYSSDFRKTFSATQLGHLLFVLCCGCGQLYPAGHRYLSYILKSIFWDEGNKSCNLWSERKLWGPRSSNDLCISVGYHLKYLCVAPWFSSWLMDVLSKMSMYFSMQPKTTAASTVFLLLLF